MNRKVSAITRVVKGKQCDLRLSMAKGPDARGEQGGEHVVSS